MSYYLFSAPLYNLVYPGGRINSSTIPSPQPIKMPDENYSTRINNELAAWSRKNPGFVPYGPLQISNEMVFQPFIKYESKLNDKFLQLFLEELKLIPETGTAYNQALENFNEISKRQLGINSNTNVPQVSSSSSSTGRGGGRRNKTNRKKTRRNKTRRN
jgi:hypothetical protein